MKRARSPRAKLRTKATKAGRGIDRTSGAIAQWEKARPDLDISILRLRTRLSLIGSYAAADNGRISRQHGVRGDDLRVLFALRRTGLPFRMRPTDLFRALLLSSGTMTHLVDRLVKSGLVVRTADPQDRRSALVSLTSRGLAVVNEAVEAAIDASPISDAIRTLPAKDSRQLESLLSRLLHYLESNN